MLVERSVFDELIKSIRDAVSERGFKAPTEIQSKAIPEILAGKNALLIAPTASGKTEAAILPVFSLYLSNKGDGLGIKILYISPLRALNRDILERFEWWGERLDLKIRVRHGDTDSRERAIQAKDPPDMLITTPETLQAILTGRVMKRHLRAVRYVVVDEIHELAEDKRGSQLALALERLRWMIGSDFQLIGLSATIGSPQEVCSFLVGVGREATVLRVPVGRQIRLDVRCPEASESDEELASRLSTHPEVAARLRLIRQLIESHKSVLLFTNTRAIAEILTSRMKVWDADFPISIHHGSLAKPSRISAERGLKSGELRGLIATSSLELGIDVGKIDYVIQYMSPRQVTRLIQRVGRSGHRVGGTADGMVLALDSDDTLESIVIARRALEESLEPVSMPQKPFDVLTHQLVGLLIQRGRWYIHEILEMFRKATPYRDLTEDDLIKVLNYMHTRYPRLAWFSMQDKVVLRPRRFTELFQYYFGKLSMIPDVHQYLVMDETKKEAVGVLDEAFVAEYGDPGTKFIVRGSPWRILGIHGDVIQVKPIKDSTGSIPSWIGEEIPIPFEIAQEVGRIRRYAEDLVQSGIGEEEVVKKLAKSYPVQNETLKRCLTETFEHIHTELDLPTDKRIVLEEWDDFIIINAHLGLLVNRTLARLLGHLLSEELGMSIGIQHDAYRIVLQTARRLGAHKVASLMKELSRMNLSELIIGASKKAGLFKRRLTHVSRRFGAISRRVDFAGISLRQLMRSFEGTVIMEEAMKETLEKDLDVPNTMKVLEEISNGIVEVSARPRSKKPSPIATIGIQRISRKTDIIPPEKMKRILLESTKVRILNESRTLACPHCLGFATIMRLKDIPDRPRCQICKQPVGLTSEIPEVMTRIREKKGRSLSSFDQRFLQELKATSLLIEKYGKPACYVLGGRRIRSQEAARVLAKVKSTSDRLFNAIMTIERRALRNRFL